MSPVTRLTDGNWHRLHPASPLLKGGIALIAILGFVIASLRERLVEGFFGSSDYGYEDIVTIIYEQDQIGWAVFFVAIALILAIAGFTAAWWMHTFRIGDDAVEVRSGILFRRNRHARLDRIQGIGITRPLFARLFGAAKLELGVAGQDAKVQLAYLRSGQVDELRQEILQRVSGARQEAEAKVASGDVNQTVDGADRSVAVGAEISSQEPKLIERRVREFLAPELAPGVAPPESVVKITPMRLIGSLLLGDFTVFLIFAVLGLVAVVIVTKEALILFFIALELLGLLGYYFRRFTKSLRFSIARTPDGVRIGYGLMTTSNDTLPPGRIHAIEVLQPLLWRTNGWWSIRVNRAGHTWSNEASGQAHTLLLPVGSIHDVEKVLSLLLPGLAGKQTQQLVLAGLTAKEGGGFTDAPRRAAWLRPFSWRRTGYAATSDAVLIRKGFIWRRLIVVPLARMQSIQLSQGPLRRAFDLARLHIHTVPGPVVSTLGVIDRMQALRAFTSISAAASVASHRDSIRWVAENG